MNEITAFADYEYYRDTFCGTIISEEDFPQRALEASRKMYNYISTIDTTYLYALENTTCSIAELLYTQSNLKTTLADLDDNQIASETLGPRSISYVNKATEVSKQILTDEELNKSIYNICMEYLKDTGMMYRGV